MRPIICDENLIAYCGLYCGACKRYLSDKCPGCAMNDKATWCEVRNCCKTNNYKTCADCHEFVDVDTCKKFNNIFAKIFKFIFKSDRKGCINFIKKQGHTKFAEHMSERKIYNRP